MSIKQMQKMEDKIIKKYEQIVNNSEARKNAERRLKTLQQAVEKLEQETKEEGDNTTIQQENVRTRRAAQIIHNICNMRGSFKNL